MFDFKEIRKLVRLLEQSEISEIEISDKDRKIRLAKPAPNDGQSAASIITAMAPAMAPQVAPAASVESPAPAPAVAANQKVVKSPMVGTYYSAPSPDADPYIQIGDYVRKGQVLCIVEAMKLMNEIESDFEGRVLEIHVENAQPVEFDHSLFTIEVA